MALYSVVFLCSTPIGGPLTGWLSEAYHPRVDLLVAAISGFAAAYAARASFRRIEPRGGFEASAVEVRCAERTKPLPRASSREGQPV